LFKNIYKPEDYHIKNSPYKLRGVFLSKSDILKEEVKKKEENAEDKLNQAEDLLKKLEIGIKEKQLELSEIEKRCKKMLIDTEEAIKAKIKASEEEAENLKTEKSKQGFEVGYQKGFDEGNNNAKNEIEKKYLNLINTFTDVVNSSLKEKHKIISNTEEEIINLAIDISKKVVQEELKISREIVINLTKEAIRKLEDKEKITIYCNPEDIELIKSHREDFIQLVDNPDILHILPDDFVDKGQCRLETHNEIIDTDIAYQFEEIKKNLSK